MIEPRNNIIQQFYFLAKSGLEPLVKANQVYFGRGSIQLSWNYNYISASVVLAGILPTSRFSRDQRRVRVGCWVILFDRECQEQHRHATIRTIELIVWKNECRETENMGD